MILYNQNQNACFAKGDRRMFIQSFSNLSTHTPACHPGIIVLSAEFDLPVDVSELFPYINAVLARLRLRPTSQVAKGCEKKRK